MKEGFAGGRGGFILDKGGEITREACKNFGFPSNQQFLPPTTGLEEGVKIVKGQ